jgi:hypothetical protein
VRLTLFDVQTTEFDVRRAEFLVRAELFNVSAEVFGVSGDEFLMQNPLKMNALCKSCHFLKINHACRRGVWSYSFSSHENAFGQGEN